MQIYFATNEKYYSRFMRWVFKEPVSHVGIGFFDGTLNLVVDCTKPYGKVYHLSHWMEKYEICFTASMPLAIDEETDCYMQTARHSVLTPYDWGAYYYGFLAGLRRRLLGIPLPLKNKWASPHTRVCTEVLEMAVPFMKRAGVDMEGVDLASVTPYMMASELYKRSVNNREVRWHGFPDKETGRK